MNDFGAEVAIGIIHPGDSGAGSTGIVLVAGKNLMGSLDAPKGRAPE